MMDAREVAIERLLPHRGAMRWVDRLGLDAARQPATANTPLPTAPVRSGR